MSTGGTLIREMSLRHEMSNPLHAIQLENEWFLVCCGKWGECYQVFVVGVDGKRVNCFHDPRTKEVRDLQGSSGAAIAKGGEVLVCEWNHTTSRILRLNRSLSGAKDLLIAAEGGLNQPWAICLDKLRDRLYVGEQRGGRVLVFDNISSRKGSVSNGENIVSRRESHSSDDV